MLEAAGGDAIGAARALETDDDFALLPDTVKWRILAAATRALFGNAKQRGIAGDLAALKFWGGIGGTFGLLLQVIQTLQLQDSLKHFIVAICGGKF